MKCRVRPELLLAGRAENGRHKTIVADWTRLHLMIFLMNALAENGKPAFKFQELTPIPAEPVPPEPQGLRGGESPSLHKAKRGARHITGSVGENIP